jgi:hypothetical protein
MVLTILHGLGHNSGANHDDDDYQDPLLKGGIFIQAYLRSHTFEDAVSPENNSTRFAPAMRANFGDAPAKDNYPLKD